MANFKPTLVIGLGSTGLAAIEHLQRYVLEELGTSELPIFQFLAFESNAASAEKSAITTIPLTIEDAEQIRERIGHPEERNDPKVQGYLDWLDVSILNNRGRIVDGAGGTRAIGRLILWENWEKVSSEIQKAYQRVTGHHNKLESEKFLNDQYGKEDELGGRSEPVKIEDEVAIYLVGTLCGGTCSGMFPDIGYLLNILAPRAKKIFFATTMTANDARERGNLMPASNNYGALKELEFFHRITAPNSWSYSLPDGIEKASPEKGDIFDLVYLISKGNNSTSLDSEDNLNQMLAMNLFLDIVGMGRTGKDAAIADLKGQMNKRLLNRDGFLKFFYSFGLSTVWYPKSKITGMSACEMGLNLCENWLTRPDTIAGAQIKEDASKDLASIINTVAAEFSKRMKDPMEKFKEQLSSLNTERNIDKPVDRLFNGKEVSNLREAISNLDEIVEEVSSMAAKKLNATVNLRFYGEYKNYPHIKTYLEKLEKELTVWMGKLPPSSDLPPNKEKLRSHKSRANAAGNDSLVKWAGVKNQAILFHREKYRDQFLKDWVAAIERHLAFKKRSVLELMIGSIGGDQYGTQTGVSIIASIRRDLATIGSTIEEVKRLLETRNDSFRKLGKSAVVHQEFISGTLEGDVKSTIENLKSSNRDGNLISVEFHLQENGMELTEENVLAFWNQKSLGIAGTILENYQSLGLKQLPGRLTEKVSSGTLEQLANNAGPYVELTRDESSEVDHRPNEFVYGYNKEQNRRIADGLQWDTTDNHCVETRLRHMLFLYREKRMFAADTLQAYNLMEAKAHQRKASGNGSVSIHKNPHFFDARRIENTEKVRTFIVGSRLLVLEEIFSGTDNANGSPIYTDNNGQDTQSWDIEKDKEMFSEIATRDGAVERLERKINSSLQKLGEDKVYLNRFNEQLNNLKEQQSDLTKGEPKFDDLDKLKCHLINFHNLFCDMYGLPSRVQINETV